MASNSTILLVDDDPAILEGVADLLRLYGYHVHTARDGREALQSMQSFEPDLVISDIMMPDMDGYEFFEAVRSNPAWTPIPFVFLTARGQPKDIRLGNMLGADAYLTKPFDPEDLLVLVHSRLKRIQDLHSVTQLDVDRIKQQLLTIFSHELRTPLTYIYGYVNLLQEQRHTLDEETVDDMLRGVQRGAERLVKLVEDLMLMVRIDSGVVGMEIALRRQPVEVANFIRLVVTELRDYAASRNVTFDLNLPSGVTVFGMEIYLRDALSRLIDNAIKFSKREGGTVYITCREMPNHFTEIVITDEGIGIEAGKIEQSFERFSQINREKMEQQGIGLGLSIVRTLIHMHRGQLEIESTVGVGTTCRLIIPSRENALDRPTPEPQPRPEL